MNCPLCDRELPGLTALLAQTKVGTQCPGCWTRLRNLKEPPLAMPAREEIRAERVRRRAA